MNEYEWKVSENDSTAQSSLLSFADNYFEIGNLPLASELRVLEDEHFVL